MNYKREIKNLLRADGIYTEMMECSDLQAAGWYRAAGFNHNSRLRDAQRLLANARTPHQTARQRVLNLRIDREIANARAESWL